MKDNAHRESGQKPVSGVEAGETRPHDIDWHRLAGDRLDRLVEIEHDHSVALERLDELQASYRGLLRSENDLRNKLASLTASNQALNRDYARAVAEFRNSRSWRITRPLRFLTRVYRNVKARAQQG